jgi:hypothetical protein
MNLLTHDVRQYTDSLKALLPPGQAWEWSEGGFGDELVLATAQELARVDVATQSVLDDAIELHRPAASGFTLADYQDVADAATQITPRKPCTIGSTVGYRLWSHNAPISVTPDSSVTLSHLMQPCAIGSYIGKELWSKYCRYYLQVRFDKSIINKADLYDALMSFKQAHVYLYVVDVADMGG